MPPQQLQGRRRPDVPFGDLPDDLQPGDYWRYLDRDSGEPLTTNQQSNLTGGVWGFASPHDGSLGTLRLHTVREHEDGTISIRPGDGSSNSVLQHGAGGETWHGYVEHGVWQEV